MRRPLVSLALAYLLGVVAQTNWPLPLSAPLWMMGISLVLWLGLQQRDASGAARWVLAVVVFIALGALRSEQSRSTLDYAFNTAEQARLSGLQSLSGRVVDIQRRAAPNSRFDVDRATVDRHGECVALPGLVRITAATGELQGGPLRMGDWVTLKGRLQPVGRAGLPHQQSWEDYLAADGVCAVVYIRTAAAVQRQQHRKLALHEWPLVWSRALKHTLSDAVADTLPPATGGLLRAMLLGERDAVPLELMDAFRSTGLAHLLTLSGLHVTALIAAVFQAFALIRLRRKQRAALAIVFTLGFLTMIGWQAPIVRATVLGVCMMLGAIVERKSDGINLLALSVLIQGLAQPLALFLLSFQLSHLIVLFLILSARCAEPLLRETYGWRRCVWSSLLSSAAALLGSLPLIANAFGIVPWISLAANLPAVALGTLGLCMGLVYAPLAALAPWAAWLLAPLIHLPLQFLAWTAQLAAWVPPLSAGPISGHAMALYYLALAIILLPLRHLPPWLRHGATRKPWAVGVLIALFLLADAVQPGARLLRIQFLALGQSDCIFIRCPGGETILVDGGAPTLDPALPSRLVRHLRAAGVRRIDLMINTHPQADHLGDLDRVLRELDVDTVLINGDVMETKIAERFAEAVAHSGVRLATAAAGMRVPLRRGVVVDVLHPPRCDGIPHPRTPNNWSIVARLLYKQFELLLTGDIEHQVEQELLAHGVELDSDILKVPHHGSLTSSTLEFLRGIDPEVAIIQTGRNRYGHPTPEVIARLHAAGAYVFITERHGTVELLTDGERYAVTSTRGRHWVRGSSYRDN